MDQQIGVAERRQPAIEDDPVAIRQVRVE